MLITPLLSYSQADIIVANYEIFRYSGSVDTTEKEYSITYEDSVYYLTFQNITSVYNEPIIWNFSIKDNDQVTESIVRSYKHQLIDYISLEFNGKEYKIYRFCYAPPNSSDADNFVFFEPNYGILINKSINWRNFEKMSGVGNSYDNSVISYFVTYVLTTPKFFHDISFEL